MFIYSNHTQAFSDTFTPSLAVYPKRNFLIVNPENISIKGIGWFVEMLGAIPISDDIDASIIGEVISEDKIVIKTYTDETIEY